jgi:hypothetical protein
MNMSEQKKLFEHIFNTTEGITLLDVVVLPSVLSTDTTHQIRVEYKNPKGMTVLNVNIDEILIKEVILRVHEGDRLPYGEYTKGRVITRLGDFIGKKIKTDVIDELAYECSYT